MFSSEHTAVKNSNILHSPPRSKQRLECCGQHRLGYRFYNVMVEPRIMCPLHIFRGAPACNGHYVCHFTPRGAVVWVRRI